MTEEWGEFLHVKGKIFDNFDEIRREIEIQTERLAGDNKGICDEPISLKIFSPKLVNLTLVDLPGFTQVAVGDQPEDIDKQVLKLVTRYISSPSSIIMAVSAANVDLANSEALKFAKQADPDGTRTLAVITKLDLMDQGTDAFDALVGRIIPVKLGIIGVVNRSQQSINDNKTIEEQLKMEIDFLEANYPQLADQNGTIYLENTLSALLVQHIQKCLPELKDCVTLKIREYQQKLKELGESVSDPIEKLIQVLAMFVKSYSAAIEGVSDNFIYGKTKLYQIFHADFEEEVDFHYPCHDKTLSQDLKNVSTCLGTRPTLFDIPWFDGPFERIAKDKINLLRNPSLECVEKVRKEMQRVVHSCGKEAQQAMKRFPKLEEKIDEEVTRMINECMKKVIELVNHAIDIETAYINTKHPDFQKLATLDNLIVTSLGRHLSNEEKQTILMRLIKLYFGIVQKTVQDTVPKIAMHYLVNNVIKNLLPHLLTNVYSSESAHELMTEPKKIATKRKRCTDMLEV